MRRSGKVSNSRTIKIPIVKILGGVFAATVVLNYVLVQLGLPSKSTVTYGIAVVIVAAVGGLALKGWWLSLKGGTPTTPNASKLAQQFNYVRSMSGTQFEHFMASLFRALGYRATVLGGAGDQGVDVRLEKGGETIAVQCKNYGKPVGNKPVQEVYAGMGYHRATKGWVVAPAGYTRGAVDLASRLGVRLHDERSIRSWIQKLGTAEAEQVSRHQPSATVTEKPDEGGAPTLLGRPSAYAEVDTTSTSNPQRYLKDYDMLLESYREALDVLQDLYSHKRENAASYAENPSLIEKWASTYSTISTKIGNTLTTMDMLEKFHQEELAVEGRLARRAELSASRAEIEAT